MKLELMNGAKEPVKAHESDACYDVFSNDDIVVKARQTSVIPLGIKLELPKGQWAEIRPRSGLSSKGILVVNGTIDSNYRGEIGAIVCNFTDSDFEVTKGFKIAQLMVRDLIEYSFEIGKVDSDTDRADKGFGSSGV